MDVTSHCISSDITESGANEKQIKSECISRQPRANGTLPHHNTGPVSTSGCISSLDLRRMLSEDFLSQEVSLGHELYFYTELRLTEEAPPPPSDRSEDGDSSDEALTNSSSTNDISRLLPTQPASALRKQKGVDSSSVASPPPVCTPPSSTFTSPPRLPPSRSYTCNRHSCSLPCHPHRHNQHSTNQKRLSSTKSSASLKTDAAHIKEVAGDDCCVHCLLACLFCEMLSMCSALGECLACGVGGAGCCEAAVGCCCVEAAGEAACTEEACQAVLDCGILEDCCSSSDCLEICLECCSICFPT